MAQKKKLQVFVSSTYTDLQAVIEKDHSGKLNDFRKLVCSKMVKFWSDPKDIKLSIKETMAEFANRPDLVGWISGTEAINSGAVVEEIARLTKENADLRERISTLSTESTKYNCLSFDEMYEVLSSRKLVGKYDKSKVLKTMNYFKDTEANLCHYLVYKKASLVKGYKSAMFDRGEEEYLLILAEIGLIAFTTELGYKIATLTNLGQQFLLRLRLQKNLD